MIPLKFKIGEEVTFINDLEHTRNKYGLSYTLQMLMKKKSSKFIVTFVTSSYLRINKRFKVCPEDVKSLTESPYKDIEQKRPELFNISKLVEQ